MIHSVAISQMVGTHYFSPLKGDFQTCIDQAAEIGYDGVELHVRNPNSVNFSALAEYANTKNIKITSIGTGMACGYDGHYLTNKDAVARREAINVFIDFIKGAHQCGHAVVLFGLMKGPLPDDRLRETYKDILFESLQPCVEAAEKYNCGITIEAINRFMAAYLWSVDETLEFVERFKSKRVTIHLDTFHMNIEDKSMRDAILKSKDRLGYFHFSDSDRCYPGHGHINFKEVVDSLYDIGFTGDDAIWAHEYDSIPDSVTSAHRGLENVKKLLH